MADRDKRREPSQNGDTSGNGSIPPGDQTHQQEKDDVLRQRDSPLENKQFTNGSKNVQYKTAQEYADALRSWLWQYHTWNCMSQNAMMFPFYAAMSTQTLGHPSNVQYHNGLLANGAHPSVQGQTPGASSANATNTGSGSRGTVRGSEYRVPPLWKRVVAEFIDFLILFVIKLSVTLVAVEYLGLIDVEHFDFDYMLLKGELDYEKAMNLSSEIIVMEVVNRIFVAIFEALCLRRGAGSTVGGATPGKRIMGLKVVSCMDVVALNNGKIFVIPARNIGFLNSLARSVVKNFSIAFFFPVCFTVMFFQHGRAAYDIISTSIVVETNRNDQA